jgi:hypothetical protein
VSNDRLVAVVEKIVSGFKNWIREDVAESVVPVVFPDVFDFGSPDIPVGVVDVPGGDIASFEDTRALALSEPVTRCTTGRATALNGPVGHSLEGIIPTGIKDDKYIPVCFV